MNSPTSKVSAAPVLGKQRPDVNDTPRSSGILLHLTSLPGGRLGDEAYRFADWLAEAGQSWWQLLPLGPPDRYRSPVQVAFRLRRLAGAAGRSPRPGLASRAEAELP